MSPCVILYWELSNIWQYCKTNIQGEDIYLSHTASKSLLQLRGMVWASSQHLTSRMTHLVRQKTTKLPPWRHSKVTQAFLRASCQQIFEKLWGDSWQLNADYKQGSVSQRVIPLTHCLTANTNHKDSHQTRKCFCLLFSTRSANQRGPKKMEKLA